MWAIIAELLVKGISFTHTHTPKRNQNKTGFVIAFDYPLELDGKTVLIKTTHSITKKKHGEINLALVWKLPLLMTSLHHA